MAMSTGRIKELSDRYAAIMSWVSVGHDGIPWSREKRVFLDMGERGGTKRGGVRVLCLSL